MLKNISLFLLLLCNILLISYLVLERWADKILPPKYVTYWQKGKKISEKKTQNNQNKQEKYLISPDFTLPDTLIFAQEQVPLSNPMVRRKLYKELVSVAFSHSTTMLNKHRSSYWFPLITPILAKYQIPEDFKYIAVIESNLQNLVSPADARGFWQFLEGTAKEYQLEISPEVDERYHPLKATEAACLYFRTAYKNFQQWASVAASYNMGMKGLQNVINQQKNNDYFKLHLNEETGRYVYRAIANKLVFENPEKYGFTIQQPPLFPNIDKLREVKVTQDIPDLVAFALSQGTDLMTLKELNPWLRANSLPCKAPKSYTLYLP